jgi:hypothetical protein
MTREEIELYDRIVELEKPITGEMVWNAIVAYRKLDYVAEMAPFIAAELNRIKGIEGAKEGKE